MRRTVNPLALPTLVQIQPGPSTTSPCSSAVEHSLGKGEVSSSSLDKGFISFLAPEMIINLNAVAESRLIGVSDLPVACPLRGPQQENFRIQGHLCLTAAVDQHLRVTKSADNPSTPIAVHSAALRLNAG